MPAGKISEDTVTAIRSALEDGCYREVSRLVGIAGIGRKTLLNWLKRGEPLYVNRDGAFLLKKYSLFVRVQHHFPVNVPCSCRS